MLMYRSITPAVYQAELRLKAVMALFHRETDTTVEEVADAHDCSPAQLYKLQRKVCEALVPAKPGPKARASTVPQLAPPPSPAPVPGLDTPSHDTHLLLTLVEHHVSVRGVRDILAVLQPTLTPEVIGHEIQRAGRAARRLMARASQQVRNTLRCLMGDDIFFQQTGRQGADGPGQQGRARRGSMALAGGGGLAALDSRAPDMRTSA